MTNQIVWTEPFMQACEGRVDARVRPDEMKTALAFFTEHLKHEPTALYLNCDMIKRLKKVIPEGIEIIEHNGVLSWEIRAADGGKVFLPTKLSPNTPGGLPSKKEVTEKPCNIPNKRQDVKISAATTLSGKSLVPLSVLSPPKKQHVKKEVLTRCSQNPDKVDVKVPVTVPSKPVTKPKVVTVGVTKLNKEAQLALMETLNTRIIKLYEKGKTRYGKSSRTIAGKLAGEGFNISHMTVSRRIREYLNA